MKYLTLFAVLILLIAGCSDTSVTEVDQIYDDRESQDQIVPLNNPEPPELVQAWDDLWMRISYKQSRGIVDTTKVLEAKRIALPLNFTKYDGPTRQAFEILEVVLDGHNAGKSIEEIKQEVRKFVQENSHLRKVNSECEEFCELDFKDAETDAAESFAISGDVFQVA